MVVPCHDWGLLLAFICATTMRPEEYLNTLGLESHHMSVASFFINNQAAIIFYAAMIGIIILCRKYIEWQTFGIGLYKTKVGLKLMEKLGMKSHSNVAAEAQEDKPRLVEDYSALLS